MKVLHLSFRQALLAFVLLLSSWVEAAPDAPTRSLLMQSADQQLRPGASLLLAATAAGSRIVAVGANGLILLSDDSGQTYRQAAVPTRLQLTSLYFVDDKIGWATGHAGLVLKTVDAGEHWQVQRQSFDVDQPLFSIYFRSVDEGWTVGLWSLMLHTTDGGKNWARVDLPVAPGQHKADLNLFHIFSDEQGKQLFVAAEHGFVLHSVDNGATWSFQATGYQGSLWTGAAWSDGTVLVGGLRGSLYRSTDTGVTWSPSNMKQTSSITSLVKEGHAVYGVGFEGLVLQSGDEGQSFQMSRRPDHLSLTAVVPVNGNLIVFSRSGVTEAPTKN